MASPFTAKASSVAPITDILKQGRCVVRCGHVSTCAACCCAHVLLMYVLLCT